MTTSNAGTVSSFLDINKLQGTQASGGNRVYYTEPGKYLVEVQSATLGNVRAGGNFFAVEAKIVTSTAKNEQLQPGCIANTYTPSIGAAGEMYLPNIMNVIQATLNATAAEIQTMKKEEFAKCVEMLLGQSQGIAGQFLIVRAVAGTTKNGARAGQPNVVSTYYHPTDEDLAEAGLVRDEHGVVGPARSAVQ